MKVGVSHIYLFSINCVETLVIYVTRIIRMCQNKNRDPKFSLFSLYLSDFQISCFSDKCFLLKLFLQNLNILSL